MALASSNVTTAEVVLWNVRVRESSLELEPPHIKSVVLEPLQSVVYQRPPGQQLEAVRLAGGDGAEAAGVGISDHHGSQDVIFLGSRHVCKYRK